MQRAFNNLYLSSFLVITLLLATPTVFAKVTAKVDRQYAYEGETVTLSVRAENSPTAREPDFSPLLENFQIGGTSKSSSISIINGRSTSSQTWSVRLQPKKLGEIEIPALTVGQETTLPFKIEIKPIPVQSGSMKGQPLFVTLEIDSKAKRYYVQQHIPLVARLYYKHEINQGTITDPVPENTILERLGEDRRYTTKHNGQDYNVFERRYSLLAEKSGELHIPSVKFQGKITATQQRQGGQRRYDPFSQFYSTPLITQGQPVSVRSEPIDLVIEPHPTDFDGQQWLPAESLTLHDSWTDNPPLFKVGEPISRTITLEAKGLVASQVQPLELPSISSFRRYAEPAETETRTDGQSVYAISRRTFTYIPAYPGEQEIPEITLKWWNVIDQKQEIARLTPWKIKVEKSLDATPTVPAPAQSQSRPQSQPAQPQQAEIQTPASDLAAQEGWTETLKHLFREFGYWFVIFIIILIGTPVLLANRKKASQEPAQPAVNGASAVTNASPPPVKVISPEESRLKARETIDTRQLLKSFEQACGRNDARSAAKILLDLASLAWPDNPPRSIGALAEQVSSGKDALHDLDQNLYSEAHGNWNGQEIYELFRNGFHVTADEENPQPALRPLYPEHD